MSVPRTRWNRTWPFLLAAVWIVTLALFYGRAFFGIGRGDDDSYSRRGPTYSPTFPRTTPSPPSSVSGDARLNAWYTANRDDLVRVKNEVGALDEAIAAADAEAVARQAFLLSLDIQHLEAMPTNMPTYAAFNGWLEDAGARLTDFLAAVDAGNERQMQRFVSDWDDLSGEFDAWRSSLADVD